MHNKCFLGKIFNKISPYTAPYIKQVGEFIQRIAQPLLNTKFGKAAVATAEFIQEKAIDAGYAVLSAAEYVIDKGTQVVNYVGTKATQAVQWIGETRAIKGIAQLSNDFASWVASTEIWKSAAEMATYLYTKMSNFCTAVSESYHYYNQCRTASRRLVIEKQGLVDEHIILKTFHETSHEEIKKHVEHYTEDEVSHFQQLEKLQ